MRLPETRDEVIANILTYDDALRNLGRYSPEVRRVMLQTLTRAMGWVFLKHGNAFRAGPLKFCGGGVSMTPEKYAKDPTKIGGTSASARIGELFFDDGELWADYELDDTSRSVRDLRALAASHDRELKSNARFYGLPGENIDDTERNKVEQLVKQITLAGLSHNARVALLARI
jgi:hypothetical protein